MSLYDQMQIAQQPQFINRVAAAAVHTALAVQTEATVDQQTITGTATSGTGTLALNGQTTSALQFNASAAAIQAALNALSTVGAGGVECTGGPLGTNPVVVNFNGPLVNGDQTVLVPGTGSLVGGTWTVAHTTTGMWVVNHAKRSALASKVLANPNLYGSLMAMGVADNATVQGDFPAANGYNVPANAAVSATTGNGVNPIVVTTATPHNLVSNQLVNISGVGGNTAANGNGLTVTVLTATTFSIPVTGNGAYTSGGLVQLSESQVGSDIQFQMNSIFTSYG